MSHRPNPPPQGKAPSMNEFSRRGFLGLAGAAGIAGLSACAGTGTAPSTGGGGGSSNTVEFWSNHPGNSKPVEQAIIKAFEAANPSLKVKLVDAGKNYEEVAQKFNASLAGGQLPDVVVVSDVTWFNFALNKQLAPMDELLSSAKIDTSDYVDALDAALLLQQGPLEGCRSRGPRAEGLGRVPHVGTEAQGGGRLGQDRHGAPRRLQLPRLGLPEHGVGVRRRLLQGVDAHLLGPQHHQGRHLSAEPRQERLPQALEGPGARLHGRHRRLQHDVDRLARRCCQGREVPVRDRVPAR